MQLANLTAEHSLLSCIFKDESLINATGLQPKHFSSQENKLIFNAMREVSKAGDPIDTVTLITKIKPENLSKIGGTQNISTLMNSNADVNNFKVYEKYIFESWKIQEAQRIKEIKIDSLEDISALKDKLSELETDTNDDDYNHRDTLIQLHKDIESQHEGLSGYDTGYKDLNRYLDGLQESDLIVVAARPSVGKTAKMLNIANKHCENGGIAAIFSLEMSTEALLKRMISSIGRIDGHKMRSPNTYFDSDDWRRYHNALGILNDMNLHIYDRSGQTVSYIRSKVRQLRNKYPDKEILVQIDYLQLMRTDRNYESKNIEVGEITRGLKELARDESVPVYLLSQLSRGVMNRQDKRPVMSDIRDSGSVEQDADVIMFLHRDDYYDAQSDRKNVIEVIIAKQRNGAVGTIEMVYRREYNLFLDMEWRHENKRIIPAGN